MLVYEYKCNQCLKEYYLRTDVPYAGAKIQCPNCSAEDFTVSDQPLPQDYFAWEPYESSAGCG